jgi:hypothetical protein
VYRPKSEAQLTLAGQGHVRALPTVSWGLPDDDQIGHGQARATLPEAVSRSHDRLCTVGRTVETGTPIANRTEEPGSSRDPRWGCPGDRYSSCETPDAASPAMPSLRHPALRLVTDPADNAVALVTPDAYSGYAATGKDSIVKLRPAAKRDERHVYMQPFSQPACSLSSNATAIREASG